MPRAFVRLLTTLVSLAFVASIVAVPAALRAPRHKGGVALDAARLAMLQVAKPTPRKGDGTPCVDGGLVPELVAVAVVRIEGREAPAAPNTFRPPALERSELMVFLN